jgi:hypothetical protein
VLLHLVGLGVADSLLLIHDAHRPRDGLGLHGRLGADDIRQDRARVLDAGRHVERGRDLGGMSIRRAWG